MIHLLTLIAMILIFVVTPLVIIKYWSKDHKILTTRYKRGDDVKWKGYAYIVKDIITHHNILCYELNPAIKNSDNGVIIVACITIDKEVK